MIHECSAKMGKYFRQTCRQKARFKTAGNRIGGYLCGTHANQYRRGGWIVEPISAPGKDGKHE